MTNVTLSIPEDIYHVMKKHPEIKWTEIMRRAAVEYAKKLEQEPERKYAAEYAIKDWSAADELFEF